MNADKPVYIHGYSQEEQNRLQLQAEFMEFIIYRDVNFSQAKKVLEVGSGVGAQTQILLRRFPRLHVQCIDVNESQLAVARETMAAQDYAQGRYDITKMDATKMTFPEDHFDGAFMCWVLEHVPDPARVLREVRRVLKPGAKIYITEVMNFSFFLDPYCPAIWRFWMTMNDYQYDKGGDPFIGVKLGNLLRDTGFTDVQTETKTLYVDKRRPEFRHQVISHWRDLIMSAVDSLLAAQKVDDALVTEMRREFSNILNNPDAIIFDSFMQASAKVP